MSFAACTFLRSGVNAAIVLFYIVFLLSLIADIADCTTDVQKCSRKCVAQNCNTVGIRYGKYCGVGWTGCPGEAPCDEVDACCQIHDDCVGEKGLDSVKCHKSFKRCINKVQKTGKAGFSKDCSYDVVIPTMRQGMDLAIMLSDLKIDL
ncbi:probable phospholipase A2 homolog 1 [Impatiens glandulifera]|uniref:probable phospholipase A2 homolog 1 n=1 Tax=Impatiens glandulifera TaxID=253017 RepID=UPI001FB0FE04|nr:probable phospholipase A2 homolog 1 [Impatiens glandulifera]